MGTFASLSFCCGPCFWCLAVVFALLASASLNAVPKKDETTCLAVSVELSGQCAVGVHTALSGDSTLYMDDGLSKTSGDEDIQVWKKRNGCNFGVASTCSPIAQPLNCTGKCWVNESRDEVYDSNSSSLRLLGILLIMGAAAACLFGCFLVCCMGPVCVEVEKELGDPGCFDSTVSCLVCLSCTSADSDNPVQVAVNMPRCFATLGLILGCLLFGIGASLFSKSGDDQWEKATCEAVTLQQGLICSIALQSGGKILSLSSEAALKNWLEDVGCQAIPWEAWSATTTGDTCAWRPGWPSECKGDCWINDDQTEVFSYPGGGFGTFLVAFLVTALSFSCLAFCVLCCFCMSLGRTVCSAMDAAEKRKIAPSQQVYGARDGEAGRGGFLELPGGEGSSRSGGSGDSRLRVALDQCIGIIGSVCNLFAGLGVLGGLFIAVTLLWVSRRYELSAQISYAGFICSLIFLLIALLVQCGLRYVRRRIHRLLDDLGANTKSPEEMQAKLVQLLISELQGKNGEEYRKKLCEAGISEGVLQDVLMKPPEELPVALMCLLGASVFAPLVCDYLEELIVSYVEPYEMMYEIMYLAFPGVLVLMSLLFSHFAISYTPRGSSGIVGLLFQLSSGFLYLKWYKFFFFVTVAFTLALIVIIVREWFVTAITVLSVILLLLSIVLYIVWMFLSSLHFLYVKPFIDAAVELMLEAMRCSVFEAFGLQRDPRPLREAFQKFEKAAGRLAPIIDKFGFIVTFPAEVVESGVAVQ